MAIRQNNWYIWQALIGQLIIIGVILYADRDAVWLLWLLCIPMIPLVYFLITSRNK